MVEMRQRAIAVIGKKGTTGASGLPAGTQHEMVDDQLAAAAEQIGQAFLARRSIENLRLFDLDPGQRQPGRIHGIA